MFISATEDVVMADTPELMFINSSSLCVDYILVKLINWMNY